MILNSVSLSSRKADFHAVRFLNQDFVLSVAASPDGNYIASGSKDRAVQCWDVRTGKAQFVVHGHKNSVISIAMSEVGGFLATGSGDWQARLFKITGMEEPVANSPVPLSNPTVQAQAQSKPQPPQQAAASTSGGKDAASLEKKENGLSEMNGHDRSKESSAASGPTSATKDAGQLTNTALAKSTPEAAADCATRKEPTSANAPSSPSSMKVDAPAVDAVPAEKTAEKETASAATEDVSKETQKETNEDSKMADSPASQSVPSTKP